MTDLTVEAFLSGGKTKSAKFEQPGDTVTGKVVGEPRMVQRKDYTTGEPLVFADSGKPQMQLAVTVQTDQRDPSDPDDDGQRTIFFRGQMRAALIDALKAGGAKIPSDGDDLYVRFTETKPSVINGKPGLPQKIFEVRYRNNGGKVGEFLTASSDARPAATYQAVTRAPGGFSDEPPF